MSSTPMNVRTLLDTVPHLGSGVSVLLRGERGIGKSAIVRQIRDVYAKRDSVDYEFIDRRLSQMTEGDLLGLPKIDKNVTTWNPPAWFKLACDKPCFLFLDELNRASHEVMQSAFELVLDRRLAGFELHPQTHVFVAVNVGGSYVVNDMDPAMLDRFWCVDLEPDVEDWVQWARSTKVDNTIIEFVAGNKVWLDPQEKSDLSSVQPSRRSWERLSNALKRANVTEEPTNPLYYSLSMGFVGVEAAIALQTFARDVYARVQPEEIMNTYSKKKKGERSPQEKIQNMQIDRVAALIDSLASYINENWALEDGKFKNDWKKVHTENLRAFVGDLSDELKYSVWSKVAEFGVENVDLLRHIHTAIGDIIIAIFKPANTNEAAVPEFVQKMNEQVAAKSK